MASASKAPAVFVVAPWGPRAPAGALADDVHVGLERPGSEVTNEEKPGEVVAS
jgi:hypothetical protein